MANDMDASTMHIAEDRVFAGRHSKIFLVGLPVGNITWSNFRRKGDHPP
jgi:hypothetical protein